MYHIHLKKAEISATENHTGELDFRVLHNKNSVRSEAIKVGEGGGANCFFLGSAFENFVILSLDSAVHHIYITQLCSKERERESVCVCVWGGGGIIPCPLPTFESKGGAWLPWPPPLWQ